MDHFVDDLRGQFRYSFMDNFRRISGTILLTIRDNFVDNFTDNFENNFEGNLRKFCNMNLNLPAN
jgi:fructose-1,6-bisphosphatase